jgi:hypothetical protein
MTADMRTVSYPVKDLGSARGLYATLLGVEPYADEPNHAGSRVADHELGLDPNGMTGPIDYWRVDKIHAAVDTLIVQGAELGQGGVCPMPSMSLEPPHTLRTSCQDSDNTDLCFLAGEWLKTPVRPPARSM